MPIRNIDGIAKQLEEAAGNELRQLDELGPELYSTADLIRLRGQWQVKMELLVWLQEKMIRLLAWTPVWMIAYGIFDYLGWGILALIGLGMIPLTFVLYACGWYLLLRFCGRQSELESVSELIEEELMRRKRAQES